MTSQEFTQHIGILLQSNSASEYLDKMLWSLHAAHGSLKGIIQDLAKAQPGSNAMNQEVNKLVSYLNEASSQFRPLRTRTVWAGVDDLHGKSQILYKTELTSNIAESIQNRLEKFSHSYEEFVKSYLPGPTFAVIDAGNDLFESLRAIKLTAKLASDALAPTSYINQSETELNLLLGSTQEAIAFARKLDALIAIYQELCELLSIPTTTHPLRIGKIESGSLWANVFGESKVIGLMIRLIESSTRYLHRNFTLEGKITEMPRKVEAVEAVLGLKQRLEEQGLDTSAMNEHIEKSSFLISQQLNTLLAGESRVVVNSIEVFVSQEMLKQAELTGENGLLTDESQMEKPIKSGDE